MTDYYATLGLPPTAGPDAINDAKRRLSFLYHPDSRAADMDAAFANRRIRAINEAWEVLSDPVRRAEYDRVVAGEGAASRSATREGSNQPSPRAGNPPGATRNHRGRTRALAFGLAALVGISVVAALWRRGSHDSTSSAIAVQTQGATTLAAANTPDAGATAAPSLTASPSTGEEAVNVTLPVVACPIDGQTGPRTPTAPPSASALLPADIANDVSLYSSWGSTTLILAPKGWKCAVSYGSSGVFTRLVPGNTPGNAADLRSSETMAGPVIVLLDWSGGTSGRYAVAGVGAPLFPDLVPFAEQLEPTPTGMRVTLWPNEIVGQRTKDFVRYEDPPNVAGTGTNQTGLQVSGSRIVGFVRLIPTQYTPPPSTPDLLLFAVRLGDSNEALENAIEAFAEERTAP